MSVRISYPYPWGRKEKSKDQPVAMISEGALRIQIDGPTRHSTFKVTVTPSAVVNPPAIQYFHQRAEMQWNNGFHDREYPERIKEVADDIRECVTRHDRRNHKLIPTKILDKALAQLPLAFKKLDQLEQLSR